LDTTVVINTFVAFIMSLVAWIMSLPMSDMKNTCALKRTPFQSFYSVLVVATMQLKHITGAARSRCF
jgi:hypothetical protein